MYDKVGRERLAKLLRLLLNGNATYAMFCKQDLLDTSDRSLKEITRVFLLSYYDDLNPNKFIVLTDPQKKIVNRCILFLQNSSDYRWPDYPDPYIWIDIYFLLLIIVNFVLMIGFFFNYLQIIIFLIINLASFMLLNQIIYRRLEIMVARWESFVDFSIWPFFLSGEKKEQENEST